MAVAVLMMVAGAQGLNYTTNGWECTAEAMGRNANCKTECEGFTALVVNQEESDKKTDDKKHCKIAARTVMEIMDAMTMRGPSEGPSGEDINLPAAMRPMNDVALVHPDPRSGSAAMRSTASSPARGPTRFDQTSVRSPAAKKRTPPHLPTHHTSHRLQRTRADAPSRAPLRTNRHALSSDGPGPACLLTASGQALPDALPPHRAEPKDQFAVHGRRRGQQVALLH